MNTKIEQHLTSVIKLNNIRNVYKAFLIQGMADEVGCQSVCDLLRRKCSTKPNAQHSYSIVLFESSCIWCIDRHLHPRREDRPQPSDQYPQHLPVSSEQTCLDPSDPLHFPCSSEVKADSFADALLSQSCKVKLGHRKLQVLEGRTCTAIWTDGNLDL